jgi:hypothetical protein
MKKKIITISFSNDCLLFDYKQITCMSMKQSNVKLLNGQDKHVNGLSEWPKSFIILSVHQNVCRWSIRFDIDVVDVFTL